MLSFACARQLTRVYIRYYSTSIDTILGLVIMNVASIELQTDFYHAVICFTVLLSGIPMLCDDWDPYNTAATSGVLIL